MIKLLSALYEAFNKSTIGQPWYPAGDTTFCNLAVNFVCNALGYLKFNAPDIDRPVPANSIVAFMRTSSDWMNIDGNVAQAHVNEGALVVAGISNPAGHGHVNIIIPGEMKYSGHLAKQVPVCMNVGKDVFIGKHIGWAFQEEPSYFVLISSLPNLPNQGA